MTTVRRVAMALESRMASDQADELQRLFARLDDEGRRSLLDFAAFLVERHGVSEAAPTAIPEPNLVPRPDNESVVKAIKRLSTSYFMVDRARILNKTSALMAEHVMQGRAATEVIDDLEALFEREYLKLKETE